MSDFKPSSDQKLLPELIMTPAAQTLFTVLGDYATIIKVIKSVEETSSKFWENQSLAGASAPKERITKEKL